MSRALNLAEDFKNIINYDKNILEWIKVSDSVVNDAYKNVASSKVIQDSLRFWIPRRGFRIPGAGFRSLSVELGFWIPIINEITTSLSRIRDCKAQDFGFQGQKFRGFWNPDSLTWGKKWIENADTYELPATQWAAVTTHWLEISDPPQMKRP